MEVIKSWLAGNRNFTVGSIIYKSVGSNEDVKALLQRGETPFSKQLLIDEFEKIIKAKDVIALPTSPAEQMPESFDLTLQSLRKKWLNPYARMNFLRFQLDKIFDDNNSAEAIDYRKQIVFNILDLESICMQVWKERDYYIKHGHLANAEQKKAEVPANPVEHAKLINNVSKNLRRNKALLQKFPAEAKYAQNVKTYTDQLKEITEKHA